MVTMRERYMRERKRIQNYISARYKKGFISEFELPAIPKRVTQGSINRLKKFTPKQLREYEKRWFSRETGEIFDSENHAELTKEYRKERKALREDRKKKPLIFGTTVKMEVEPSNVESKDMWRIFKSRFVDMLRNLSPAVQAEYTKIIEQLRAMTYDDSQIFEAFAEANGGEFFAAEDYYKLINNSNFLSEVLDILGAGISLEDFEESVYEDNYYDFEIAMGG